MGRLQTRFLESDNKVTSLRVYPDYKASILTKNYGETSRASSRQKPTYVNETSLAFPKGSWIGVEIHLGEIMPKGFWGSDEKQGKKDFHHLLNTRWELEPDLLHMTFSPDYSVTFQYEDPFKGSSTYAPWYWLFSEERQLTERILKNEIKRDSKGRRKKTGKHSY